MHREVKVGGKGCRCYGGGGGGDGTSRRSGSTDGGSALIPPVS